jgi:CRISPR-associated protein Csx17
VGEGRCSGFVNPWAFLLTLEGALLFATAVVRRHGADYQGGAAGQRNAVPFQVRGSTAGYPAAAAGENPLAELWTPEWARPAGIVELEHLFGEGRVEWGGRPARTGLDFARAVTTLGVDRGLTAFERHLFVDRLGRNPLAVPSGRVEVDDRPIVGALDGLDGWLDRLRWDRTPATVVDRRRELESALFALASSGGNERIVEVIVSLGRCHEAVARSGAARERANPLLLRGGQVVLDAVKPAVGRDVDLRIALAIATAQDHGTGIAGQPLRTTLRELLTPVSAGRWTDRPVGAAVGLVARLAEAARHRAFPGATAEISTDVVPAVGGPRLPFTAGLRLDAGDVAALVHGRFDEGRCSALVSGLLCFDWPPMQEILHASVAADAVPDPAVDMLLPFTSTEPLILPDEEGARRRVLMRLGSAWPVLLAAGRIGQVLRDAARRLRINGVRHVVDPGEVDPIVGIALAALLIVPVAPRLRLPALSRVAALPTVPIRPNAPTSSKELA